MKKLLKILKNILMVLFFIFSFILLAVGIIGHYATDWFNETFGVTFREIIYTAKSPMKGADTSFISKAISYCTPGIIITICLIFLVLIWEILFMRKTSVHIHLKLFNRFPIKLNVKYINRILLLVIAASMTMSTFFYADQSLKVTDYIESLKNSSTIYEDEYIDPNTVNITSRDGQKKNLIYIYMESMETTYASKDVGGYQDINYIPNLTQYAQTNINFTNKDGLLGGWHAVQGTGWTMAALLSTTSGIPFSFPTEQNSMNERQNFASGLTNLGDILEKEGYNQEFLCGSDSEFAGRKEYFQQHGNYDIFDYYTAIEKGYIPEGRYVWWGFEDMYLYQIAKDEITRLASEDQPFNFTMLTVDTHHIDGYVCDLCQDEYPEQLANVVACADRQVNDFIQWCEQQPFFENTQIIITGDHPRMDNDLVAGVDYYDRTVYNCFISADPVYAANTNNREFASMDMFPSILYFLGYDIEGDRLGLGTNLFSDKKTLMEKYGYDDFNDQLSRYSQYYIDHFS